MRRSSGALKGCFGFVLAVALECQGVSAQEETISKLMGCASIGKDSERLACYDRLTEGLRSGGKEQAIQPSSAEGLFGLNPGAEPANPKEPAERTALKSVSAHVASIRELPQGGVVLNLDNGQTWRQIGTSRLELQVGDAVQISRAALGSFWLKGPAGGAHVSRLR